MLAENNLELPVSLTQALMAFTTSGMHSFNLAENLVALGLIVLDEITSLPERVAGLTKRLGLQTQLWLDDGANHQTTVGGATAQDTPHVLHVHGRSIVQPEECWRQVEVVDLAVLHVAHACQLQRTNQQT